MKNEHKFKVGEPFMVLEGIGGHEFVFNQQILSFPFLPINEVRLYEISCIYVLLALPLDKFLRSKMLEIVNPKPSYTNSEINTLPWVYVYIGKTENLANEFIDHSKLECLIRYEISILLTCPLGNETSEDIINELLQNYPFVCNKA